MADLGWPELSIIVIAFVLFFGWKRMPDMARSLGRSARIFKSEVDQLRTDGAAPAGPAAPSEVPKRQAANPSPYSVQPSSLEEAQARAAATEAELASLRAEAELARRRAEREALDRGVGGSQREVAGG